LLVLLLAFVAVSSVTAADLKPEIEQALRTGDTTGAIDLLRSQTQVDKNYHYNYYVLGRIFYNQERYQDARQQFKTALDKKSKDWESLYYLGLAELKLERFDEAKKIMLEGQKKAKDEKHMFHNGLGLVLLAQGEYVEADRAFRLALVERPNNPEYLINLGDANYYQGVPSLAISQYQKAIDVDTASLEVYYHWAEACLEMRDFQCAIEKLQYVLSKDSSHAGSWQRAGQIYFRAARSARTFDQRRDHYRDALGSYRKYLEISNAQPDSAHVRSYFEIAMSYLGLNGFEDAVEHFEKVLAIPYEPKDVHFYYGKALWGTQQNYEKAAEALHRHLDWVAQQDSDYRTVIRDDELYMLLGDSYYYRKPNDFATAILYYDKVYEIDSTNKRVLLNLGIANHAIRNFGRALYYYDQRIALGVDERSASVLKNAGSCALNIANLESGTDHDIDIDDIDAMDGGGVMVASTDQYIDPGADYFQVAVGYFDKYLAYVPDDSRYLELAGQTTLYQLSDCEQGVHYFTRLLEVEPANCIAKRSLGYAYFGGVCPKNYNRALGYLLDAYQCITKESGECGDVDLTLWIAQCYHLRAAEKMASKQDANEDFKNAYNWYGKVLKCDPTNKDAKKGQDDTRFEFVD
jgi:tetratricopeptide (TPR) repeat protein